MKLTKEQVYIKLQGKTEEELTELYNFLESVGESNFDKLGCLIINNYWKYLALYTGDWVMCNDAYIKNKKEVTIEQLKEILKPMDNKEQQLRKEAKERGYTHDNFKCLIGKNIEGIEDIDRWYYSKYDDALYSNTEGQGGNVVYRNGVWAERIYLTLEQQLQKAEDEVKRLKNEIKYKTGAKVEILITEENREQLIKILENE